MDKSDMKEELFLAKAKESMLILAFMRETNADKARELSRMIREEADKIVVLKRMIKLEKDFDVKFKPVKEVFKIES